MSSSCPYCGAVLKLRFCVVCGRQSKLNKMGQIRSTARNTDTTQRLEDPLYEDEPDPQKSLRFHQSVRPLTEAILGGLIAGILIFCAAKQVVNFFGPAYVGVVSPWMKSHHFVFPQTWLLLTKKQADATHKIELHRRRSHKNRKVKE